MSTHTHIHNTHTHMSDIVRSVFTADSLALGVHWCYYASVIAEKRGASAKQDLLRLHAPDLVTYHPEKSAGDLTNNGDQAFFLLQSLSLSSSSSSRGFDAKTFVETFVSGYKAEENKHLYR